MNNSEYEVVWGQWRNLIGDFMMEFSEIEYISYSLWTKKVNKGKPEHNFKARTRQVISQLNGKKDTNIKVLLERAIEVANKRNTIAHNPTLLQIFKDNDPNKFRPEFSINTYRTGDSIDIFDLEELTAEVIDIKTQLYMSLGYLPHEDSHG